MHHSNLGGPLKTTQDPSTGRAPEREVEPVFVHLERVVPLAGLTAPAPRPDIAIAAHVITVSDIQRHVREVLTRILHIRLQHVGTRTIAGGHGVLWCAP